jgi:predicted anti-sigma-YlaC factor YlaD
MRATRKISCEEATRLISAGLDRELSPPARATLRLHQTVCNACRRFEQQMLLLRRALRGQQAGDDEPDDTGPSKGTPP